MFSAHSAERTNGHVYKKDEAKHYALQIKMNTLLLSLCDAHIEHTV